MACTDAIMYILRMRIVRQTTPYAPSSNIRILSCMSADAFSEARPSVKLA